MRSCDLATLPLLMALVSAACGQEFNQLSSQLEFASCQPEEELPSVRSDIECLVRAAPAQVTVFRTDTARCSRMSRCDLIKVSNASSAVRPESTKIYHQPVRRLLFAVKAGSGVGAYSSYTSSASCINSMLLLPYGQAPTVQTWRSCWLDRLPELVRQSGMTSIVLHIIKGGSDVMNITFDATFDGVTTSNWFAKERVTSYWPASLGIPSKTFNYFFMPGGAWAGNVRTFFINLAFPTGSCPGDLGYLFVAEVADTCGYANLGPALPRIIFNVDSTVPFSSAAATADYLAISVM